MGPKTIPRDRLDYSSAIAESWKRHALLNVVKLRYFDPPISVDVGQIVAGYSLETEISLGGSVERDNASFTPSVGAHYTDRPTITYTPLTGNRFVRTALMPLPPDAVFFTVQAGWPADGVLFAAVASLNGLKNQEGSLAGVTPPEPAFLRTLDLLLRLQQTGAFAVRIQQDAKKQQTTWLVFRSQSASAETLADLKALRTLLRLNPEASEYKLVFGATPGNDRELAVMTRSMTQIMGMLSAYVQVPEAHIAEGRATPGLGGAAALRIACSPRRPSEAFAAVAYRDLWFWIDDRDLKTKRAFALLMMLGTMADTGEHPPLPLITIPTQ
jgi:hypothetical protein